MTLHSDLVAAGLPVNGTAIEGQTVLWTRALTPAELVIAEDIINPEKAAKKARKAAAIATINGLAGRNLSSINNTADRDALLKAICYMLGICDENGLILEQPIDNGASAQQSETATKKK